MGKVIVKRLIRHLVNSFVKIPAKFFRAETKKSFSPRHGDAKKKRKKEKKKNYFPGWFRKTLTRRSRNQKGERR